MAGSYNKQAVSADAVFGATLYVAVALLFGIWLTWDAAFSRIVSYLLWANYWEYTAVLTEWMQHFTAPANPHLATDSLSPAFMPWFWLLSFSGLYFDLNAIELMGISAVFNYSLIVVGLYLFTKIYFCDSWAPLVAFVAIFMCWGAGMDWPNLHQFNSLFYIAGYPSSLVFGLSLISFWVVLRMLREGASLIVTAFFLVLLTALMFLCDPLTAVFGIAGCGLLVITATGESLPRRIMVVIALLAGLAVTSYWPYYPVWQFVAVSFNPGGDAASAGAATLSRFRSGDWQHFFYEPRLIMAVLGPALIGVPICLWLLLRRQYLFIAFGALLMCLIYGINLFIEIPYAHQFILFAAVYFQLAIVWCVLRVIDDWQSLPCPPQARFMMWVTMACLSAVVVFNIVILKFQFDGSALNPKTMALVDTRGYIPPQMSVVDLYADLTKPLPESAVVLSTSLLSWPLPTAKAKVVSLYRSNPLVADINDRHAATAAFFFKPLSDAGRAVIIRRYGVTHVLVNTVAEPVEAPLLTWLNQHALPVAQVGDFLMYDLVEASLGPVSTDENLQPAVGDPPDVQQPADALETVDKIAPAVVQDPQGVAVVTKPTVVAAPAAGADKVPSQAVAAPASTRPESKPAAEADVEPEPAAFGVPISKPMLDPAAHGG